MVHFFFVFKMYISSEVKKVVHNMINSDVPELSSGDYFQPSIVSELRGHFCLEVVSAYGPVWEHPCISYLTLVHSGVFESSLH